MKNMKRTQTLIKLTLEPYRDYHKAKMIDYKLINHETASVVKSFLRKYSSQYLHVYCSEDAKCALSNVKMEMEDDETIIEAFELLRANKIVESSYHLYEIITIKLMNIGDPDEKWNYQPSEADIIHKWNQLQPNVRS